MGLSIEAMAARWRAQQPSDDPDAFERLEERILRRTPRSASEAAIILEVVAVCVSGGGRSDGLDVNALEAVTDWLRQFESKDARAAA